MKKTICGILAMAAFCLACQGIGQAVVRPPSFDRDIAADGPEAGGIAQEKHRFQNIVTELEDELFKLQRRLQEIRKELAAMN